MPETSPLITEILFHIGPVPISRSVVTSWGIMLFLVLVSWFGMRRAAIEASGLQAVLEIIVEAITTQIRDVIRRDAWPYLPLVGTMFLFLVIANLSAVIPGMKPPTGHLETPAALSVIVFFSIHYFGIRSHGFANYARHYLQPSPIMLPLNLLSEITRIFSLMIRLFGNMMSHEFVLAIVVFLAGLFVPVPFMLLGILIGIIQAYIFTILTAVFIGAAVGTMEAS